MYVAFVSKVETYVFVFAYHSRVTTLNRPWPSAQPALCLGYVVASMQVAITLPINYYF
jgi:hypothetical protein